MSTQKSLPASFGRYRIRSLLGPGAQADVYLAEEEELSRPVALKVLNARGDAAALARFDQYCIQSLDDVCQLLPDLAVLDEIDFLLGGNR